MTRDWITSFFFVIFLADNAFGWHYTDQRSWGKTCLAGKKQSPIALSRRAASQVMYTPFIWERYETNVMASIKNNGHSAEVRFEMHPDTRPEVKGGNLPNIYVLDHLHFHWQSEHTMDSYRFPLELHMVHYAKQHGNISEALKVENGVAVFGIFFDASPDDYSPIKSLVSIVDSVKQHHNAELLSNFNIQSYIPHDTAGYFRYSGSLTTPECNEGILWTVLTNTMPISQSQVKIFESIQVDGHKLNQNYRDLQNLNNRKLYLKVSPMRGSAALNVPSLFIVSSLGLVFYVYNFRY